MMSTKNLALLFVASSTMCSTVSSFSTLSRTFFRPVNSSIIGRAFLASSLPSSPFESGRILKYPNQNMIQDMISPPTLRMVNTDSSGNEKEEIIRSTKSVTGPIYTLEEEDGSYYPKVQLYTKEGCTLCDKVCDVLKSIREDAPHSLEAIDITDVDKKEWWDRYKWDIPVLHINGNYWTKHRLSSADEATQVLQAVAKNNGVFEEQRGQPNAAKYESK